MKIVVAVVFFISVYSLSASAAYAPTGTVTGKIVDLDLRTVTLKVKGSEFKVSRKFIVGSQRVKKKQRVQVKTSVEVKVKNLSKWKFEGLSK